MCTIVIIKPCYSRLEIKSIARKKSKPSVFYKTRYINILDRFELFAKGKEANSFETQICAVQSLAQRKPPS